MSSKQSSAIEQPSPNVDISEEDEAEETVMEQQSGESEQEDEPKNHVKEVDQVRTNLELNQGWKKVLRPADVEKYMSKLQQFAINTPFSIEAPVVKGKQSCPVSNGETWDAYLKPIPSVDKHLGQQWVIHRKDFRNKNTKLFCYPKTDYNGEEINIPEGNEPVDLDMFTYVSPDDVKSSLETLVDLMLPNSSLTNIEKQRNQITQSIIEAQNNNKLQQIRKEGIEKLMVLLSTFNQFSTSSKKARELLSKKEAKNLINIIHNVAIANVGLSQGESIGTEISCADGEGELREIKGVNVCFPKATDDYLNEQEKAGKFTAMELRKLKKFLMQYAKTVVKVKEAQHVPDFEDGWASLTKEQLERQLYYARGARKSTA